MKMQNSCGYRKYCKLLKVSAVQLQNSNQYNLEATKNEKIWNTFQISPVRGYTVLANYAT